MRVKTKHKIALVVFPKKQKKKNVMNNKLVMIFERWRTKWHGAFDGKVSFLWNNKLKKN